MSPAAHAMFAAMCVHLEDAAMDLFGDVGVHVTASPCDGSAPSGTPTIAASIGYTSEHVRGSLLLLAPSCAVDTWCSADMAGIDGLDVVGELSNQLLGRLKNKLLGKGLCLLLSTPTCTRGASMVFPPWSASSGGYWVGLDGPGWAAKVRLEAEFTPDFAICATRTEVPAAAGELLLF